MTYQRPIAGLLLRAKNGNYRIADVIAGNETAFGNGVITIVTLNAHGDPSRYLLVYGTADRLAPIIPGDLAIREAIESSRILPRCRLGRPRELDISVEDEVRGSGIVTLRIAGDLAASVTASSVVWASDFALLQAQNMRDLEGYSYP